MSIYLFQGTLPDIKTERMIEDATGEEPIVYRDEKGIDEVGIQDHHLVIITQSCPFAGKAFHMLFSHRAPLDIIYLNMRRMTDIVANENVRCTCVPMDGSDLMKRSISETWREIRPRGRKDDRKNFWWGKSEKMQEVRRRIRGAMKNGHTIHISGEIGTGKSELAKECAAIGAKHIVTVDCSLLSNNMLAMDELFGHVKGAYTDSVGERSGAVADADKGVLFLDEIQNLDAESQGRLLTVIETHRFRRLGSDKPHTSYFHLITASSLSREELSKKICPALMSRIGVIPVEMPAIRERKEDIPYFIKKFEYEIPSSKRDYRIYDMEPWMKYRWPDNVRGIRRAVAFFTTMGFFPEYIE